MKILITRLKILLSGKKQYKNKNPLVQKEIDNALTEIQNIINHLQEVLDQTTQNTL